MDEEFVNKGKDLVLQVQCTDAHHTVTSMQTVLLSAISDILMNQLNHQCIVHAQFSVKHTQDLDCGGGYLKLMPTSRYFPWATTYPPPLQVQSRCLWQHTV